MAGHDVLSDYITNYNTNIEQFQKRKNCSP